MRVGGGGGDSYVQWSTLNKYYLVMYLDPFKHSLYELEQMNDTDVCTMDNRTTKQVNIYFKYFTERSCSPPLCPTFKFRQQITCGLNVVNRQHNAQPQKGVGVEIHREHELPAHSLRGGRTKRHVNKQLSA